MRGRRAQRPFVRDALHTVETAFQQLVGSRLDPAGHFHVRRAAVGRVVLESTVVGRIVRRRDHDSVGEARRARPVVAHDGVRDGRGRRVLVVLGEHHVHTVGREHLERGGAGRRRQRVRVQSEKERAVDSALPAVAADGFADRQHVPFIERSLERRAAMSRGAERDPFSGHRWIGRVRVVRSHQPGDVEEHGRPAPDAPRAG